MHFVRHVEERALEVDLLPRQARESLLVDSVLRPVPSLVEENADLLLGGQLLPLAPEDDLVGLRIVLAVPYVTVRNDPECLEPLQVAEAVELAGLRERTPKGRRESSPSSA